MATFLVDRALPGLSVELLLEAQRCLREAVRRVSAGGEQVRYLRCTFLPGEQRCLCLFEADSASAVRRVNEIAQVPFRRIEPVQEYVFPGGPQAPERRTRREQP